MHEVKPLTPIPVNESYGAILWQAILVTVGAVLVGFAFNAVRSDKLPWIQTKPYAILVPCPEPVGDAEPMAANDARVNDSRSLVVDVRSSEEFAHWHVPGAQNEPFDWLGPPVDAQVKELAAAIAASRAQRVIVYGDGDDPDSGQEWARLLSGARIKNVFFVRGGAPALNPALPKPVSDVPPFDDADPQEEPADESPPVDTLAVPPENPSDPAHEVPSEASDMEVTP